MLRTLDSVILVFKKTVCYQHFQKSSSTLTYAEIKLKKHISYLKLEKLRWDTQDNSKHVKT